MQPDERPLGRLLITRPQADAAPLARRLARLGFTTLVEPLLEIVYREGPPLDLSDVQALLATSGNGIRAFARRDQRRHLPVLAVGDATARTASAAGFTQVETAAGDVAALADLAVRRFDPEAGALLHVAAGDLAGDLAGRLVAAGFRYRREVLYAAVTARRLSPAAREALQGGGLGGGLAGVLLFSPRTAATFARLVGEAGDARVCARLLAFCLSRAVADEAAALAWRRIVIAPEPTEAALVAAIVGAMPSPEGRDARGERANSVSPRAREP